MIRWNDAHNHFADPRLAEIPDLWQAARAAGVERMIVNATCEADWPAVEKLAAAHPDHVIPAFGIHPWQAHLVQHGWEKRLARLLEKYPGATLGEIGLDGWVAAPPLEVQMPVFETQLRLARTFKRSVTIHCLKAWQPLFASFEQEKPPAAFLMHSFGGSLEIARRLLPIGAFFSFSGYFLHERKSKVLEVFRNLPRERILLETDAPDMLPPAEIIGHSRKTLNHPANLPAIGNAFATHLEIAPEELAKITHENFSGFLTA